MMKLRGWVSVNGESLEVWLCGLGGLYRGGETSEDGC